MNWHLPQQEAAPVVFLTSSTEQAPCFTVALIVDELILLQIQTIMKVTQANNVNMNSNDSHLLCQQNKEINLKSVGRANCDEGSQFCIRYHSTPKK